MTETQPPETRDSLIADAFTALEGLRDSPSEIYRKNYAEWLAVISSKLAKMEGVSLPSVAASVLGSSKSDAKSSAARSNGSKGGRPRKPV